MGVELRHHVLEGLPVPRMEPVGLGGGRLGIAEEDGALAVRQRDAGHLVGVQIAQAPLRQLQREIGVGLRDDEQGVGAGIDVVAESREHQLLGPHQPTRPVVPFQHQNAPPRASEIGGGDERVVAAADEDGVELRHVGVLLAAAGEIPRFRENNDAGGAIPSGRSFVIGAKRP